MCSDGKFKHVEKCKKHPEEDGDGLKTTIQYIAVFFVWQENEVRFVQMEKNGKNPGEDRCGSMIAVQYITRGLGDDSFKSQDCIQLEKHLLLIKI